MQVGMKQLLNIMVDDNVPFYKLIHYFAILNPNTTHHAEPTLLKIETLKQMKQLKHHIT